MQQEIINAIALTRISYFTLISLVYWNYTDESVLHRLSLNTETTYATSYRMLRRSWLMPLKISANR